MKKIVSVFVGLVLIVTCLSFCTFPALAHSTAEAVEALDPSAKCSLGLTFAHDGIAFEGQEISIFKAVDINRDLQFTLTSEFENKSVVLEDFVGQSDYNALASTLYSVALNNKIKAVATQKTDKDGKVSFSELSVGMYLVSPVGLTKDDVIYSFDPFMVVLPDIDTDGKYVYDVNALPKSDAKDVEKQTYKIVVNWQDAENPDGRPESVTFNIYDDGVCVKTVTVTEKDNWTYEWSAVDDGSVWTVAQNAIGANYSTGIVRKGNVFTVTNTYIVPEKTGDTQNIGLYVAILLLSAIAVVAVVVLKKKVK